MRRVILVVAAGWAVGGAAAPGLAQQKPDPVEAARAVVRAAQEAARAAEAEAVSAGQKAEQARAKAQRAAQEVRWAEAALAHTAARVAQKARQDAQKAFEEREAAGRKAAEQAARLKEAAEQAGREARAAADEALQAERRLQAAREELDRRRREAASASEAERAKVEKALEAPAGAVRKAEEEKSLRERRSAEKAKAAEEARRRAAEAQAAADRAWAESREAFRKLEAATAAWRAAEEEAAAARAAALGGLKPLSAACFDEARARHLLWRAGFGGTPEEVARLCRQGLHASVRELVYYTNVPAAAASFEAWPRESPHPWLPYEAKLIEDERLHLESVRQEVERRQVRAFRAWWLGRMAESPRPLQEKLALFWHGHFATQYSILDQQGFLLLRQIQMFRQHATDYRGLLRGLVHDAAMIRYLNNDTNTRGKPNENLAREILELFSMGVGNYTEEDIRQAARALTGYTYDRSTGEFRFVRAHHDEGPKKIWSHTGPFTGDDLVDLILQNPATARFLARKLFIYFVHDDPSGEVVEHLASVLRESRYNVAVLLENLFASEEFYSPRALGSQIKSPVELVVGTLRALGVRDGPYEALADAVRRMGQELLEPPNVKGWEGGRSWIDANRVFHRYNAVADLIESLPRPNGTKGVDVVSETLGGRSFSRIEEVVEYLVRSCLGVPLSEGKKQALAEIARALPAPSEWSRRKEEANAHLRALLVALTSCPEYQVN